MLTATAYDTHVEQLFESIRQLHALLTRQGIPYRIVGGLAVFIHVSERDPLRARLTADVDAAINRIDLPAVIAAAQEQGWLYRHVSGVDTLVDAVGLITPEIEASLTPLLRERLAEVRHSD